MLQDFTLWCNDLYSPVEGVLIQNQTRCYGNALLSPSGTPLGGCRSPPAQDQYCSVVVTPLACICQRKSTVFTSCTSGGANSLWHEWDVFTTLTWCSRRGGWDRGWYCRLLLKRREPCTEYCCQRNLKGKTGIHKYPFDVIVIIFTPQNMKSHVPSELESQWNWSWCMCADSRLFTDASSITFSYFHWQGQAPSNPFPPVTLPCTQTPLSQRVIDHIPFLDPADQLSLWHGCRSPRGTQSGSGALVFLPCCCQSHTHEPHEVHRPTYR